MNGLAIIQMQLMSGNWQTICSCSASQAVIKMKLDGAVRTNPGKRLRAMSPEGAFIDLR